jgi:UrcA family protein
MFTLNDARKYLVSIGALACVGVGGAALPAHAQDTYDRDGYAAASTDMDGVTVFAPYRHERDGATGAPIETVRASRVVYFRDLDPNSRFGHHVLVSRIRGAARDACQQIDRENPLTDNMDDRSCIRAATERAINDVDSMTGYAGD